MFLAASTWRTREPSFRCRIPVALVWTKSPSWSTAVSVIPTAGAPEHVFTFEEYIRIVETSPTRLDFWEGVILDMAGGSPPPLDHLQQH